MLPEHKISSFLNARRPTDDLDPELKKGADYILEWAKYIAGQLAGGNAGHKQAELNRYKENRQYGVGLQNPNKYMRAMGADTDQRTTSHSSDVSKDPPSRGAEQKNYINLNWEEASPMVKFRHIVVNKFMEVDHVVDISETSSDVNDKRMMDKYRNIVQSENPQLKQLVQAAQGISQTNEQVSSLPTSRQEFEIIDRIGGIKMAFEIAHKKALRGNFHQSDWPEIKRKILGDLFDMNIGGTRNFRDTATGKVKVRYVDPLRSGFQYSRSGNSKNSSYWFEVVDYSIAELRELTGLDEQEITKLAKDYQGYSGNPAWSAQYEGTWQNEALGLTGFKCDEFKIPVLDFEVRSIDTKYHTKRTKPDGSVSVYREKYGKEYKSSKQREIVKERYQNLYRGKWIVGTDHVFDYGPQYNIPRDKKSECRSTFNFYVIEGRSLCDLLRPDTDKIIVAAMKVQNEMAKSHGSGIAIEWGSLSNMKLGNNDAKPMDILRIYNQSGNLVYKQTTHAGGISRMGGSGFPFKELQGGIGTYLQELMLISDKALGNMRMNTGINEIIDGSSPNPEVTAKASQLAAMSGNNALASLYRAYLWLKKETSITMVLQTNIALRHDQKSYEVMYPVIGGKMSEVVKLTSDDVINQLGLTIRVRRSNERRQEFMEAAKMAFAEGKLAPEQYFSLIDLIDEGLYEEAMVLMVHHKQMSEAQAAAIQSQHIREQGEQQRLMSAEKDKRDIDKAKVLSDIKVKEAELLAAIDIKKQQILKQTQGNVDIEVNTAKEMAEKVYSTNTSNED